VKSRPAILTRSCAANHGRGKLPAQAEKTRRDRAVAKLKEVRDELRRRMHLPHPLARGCGCGRSSPASMVTMQCRPTSRHLRPSGSMSPDSGGARFDGAVKRTARRWARIEKLAHDFLPKPRILHPWPSERFAVKHQGGEPYAGKLHGGICGGCAL